MIIGNTNWYVGRLQNIAFCTISGQGCIVPMCNKEG